MNVMNCKMCGRLFNILANERICPDCRTKLENKFQEVRNYLDEHPEASVDEVSKQCEVTTRQITSWVREERLRFSDNSMEGIPCENCGKTIRTGRFCNSCKGKLANSLMSAIDKGPEKKQNTHEKGNHMRFL